MESRKGQASLELFILIGFMMVSFIIFFMIVQENLSDNLRERQNVMLLEVAFTIKDEIDIASSASEGYNREFKLPKDIFGKEYEAVINDEVLSVRTLDGSHSTSVSVKNFIGVLNKNENFIQKKDGQVRLNL